MQATNTRFSEQGHTNIPKSCRTGENAKGSQGFALGARIHTSRCRRCGPKKTKKRKRKEPLRNRHFVPNVPKTLGHREAYPANRLREECREGQQASDEQCQMNAKVPSAMGAEGWEGLEPSIKGKGRI